MSSYANQCKNCLVTGLQYILDVKAQKVQEKQKSFSFYTKQSRKELLLHENMFDKTANIHLDNFGGLY